MYCILPSMRCLKIKLLFITVINLAVFLFFLMIQSWFKNEQSTIILPNVIVHIDLKGAPPKIKYLESLLPMMKEHGVNGLLIEYEDMFPYEGKLVNISAKNCYTKDELKNFLMKAAHLKFQIIPLIQTFGHMEHVLKLQEFRHLREIFVYPDSLCPSKVESQAIIKHMLDQIIDFHNTITPLKHIHVGYDEVYHINKCEQCAARKAPNVAILLEHLRFISEYLFNKSPGINTLIWDDMLRTLNQRDWNTINLLRKIEPVYWNYDSELSISHQNLLNYHQAFTNIWIASAFKGADGRITTLPDMNKRFMNHFGWLNFIMDYKFGGEDKVYNFEGIILTGWSRYSHMDPLCELLPAAIPSLTLNLILIQKFKTGVPFSKVKSNQQIIDMFDEHIVNDLKRSLKCNMNRITNTLDVLDCDYESSSLYNVLKQYGLIKANIVSHFNNDLTALSAFEYYASKKYINMNNVMGHIHWCNNTLNELINVEKLMSHLMKRYYEQVVIDEYVNYKIDYLKRKLRTVLRLSKGYVRTRVWERNPFAANMSV